VSAQGVARTRLPDEPGGRSPPHPGGDFAGWLRRAMDILYWTCASISSAALVAISAIIPWGVYTRYVVNRAASWPEPAAVLLAIVLTFFGAAACYRADVHMRITVLRDLLPDGMQRATNVIAELLVGALSVFMTVWGIGLCDTTWNQTIDEFPFLRVGITYLPIPIGGVFTTLFVVERLLIGPPAAEASPARPVTSD
jgi:TRAP-type C4-dicarboxylate transport system permease small subunit